MRFTRRGWLQHLRSARLGAAVWMLAFVGAVTALPLLHTAFHDLAHGHHGHAIAHDRFKLPSYVDVFGEEPPHHHGDGVLHSHGDESARSALEELDPVLALQLATPAPHAHPPSHEHDGTEHGQGSLEHLDAAWLAAEAIALLPPAATVACIVTAAAEAPACANYLLAPLKAQAPPASAATA